MTVVGVVHVLWGVDGHFEMSNCVSVSPVQNMSTFESELESLLGEFHIKMKGEPESDALTTYEVSGVER